MSPSSATAGRPDGMEARRRQDADIAPWVIRAFTSSSRYGLSGRISMAATVAFRSALGSGFRATVPSSRTLPFGAHSKERRTGMTAPSASVRFPSESCSPRSDSWARRETASSATSTLKSLNATSPAETMGATAGAAAAPPACCAAAGAAGPRSARRLTEPSLFLRNVRWPPERAMRPAGLDACDIESVQLKHRASARALDNPEAAKMRLGVGERQQPPPRVEVHLVAAAHGELAAGDVGTGSRLKVGGVLAEDEVLDVELAAGLERIGGEGPLPL